MLTLLFVVTFIFFVVIGRIRTGNIYNPLTLFLLFWCFWVVVSLGNPYGLNEVSTNTYLIVWGNVVFTSLGFVLVSKRVSFSFSKDSVLAGSEFIKSKLFILMNVTLFILLIYYYRKYNAILAGVYDGDMRDLLFDQGYLFSSTIERLFYFSIITTLVYLSICLLITSSVMGGKNRLLLLLCMTNGVLLGMIGGGRFVYFHMIVFLLTSIGIKRYLLRSNGATHKIRVNKKWALYGLLFVFAVYVMNYTSAIRMGVSTSIKDSFSVLIDTSLPQMVVYFAGPFRALDMFLHSDITISAGHTFGRSTFGGLEEMVSWAYNLVGGSLETANAITSSFTAPTIWIGSSTTFNAFYTSVMNFYMDGGTAFVLLFALVFGAITGFIYNYCLRNLNLYTMSLLIYTTYQVISSEFRWNYTAPSTWIVILILFYLSRRHKKKLESTNSIPVADIPNGLLLRRS